MLLPGEELLDLEPHNFDARFLTDPAMGNTKDQELAEEVVVAVKPVADENVATHLRIKLSERDRTLKAKDGTNNKRRNSTFNSCLKVRNQNSEKGLS